MISERSEEGFGRQPNEVSGVSLTRRPMDSDLPERSDGRFEDIGLCL